MTLQILFPDGPEPTVSDHEARLLWPPSSTPSVPWNSPRPPQLAALAVPASPSATKTCQVSRALECLWNGATDHFDSPDHTGPAIRPLSVAQHEFHDRLGEPPRFYRMRLPEEADYVFWSYSGPYREGDRLVYHFGEEYRVIAVAPSEDDIFDEVLVVERAPVGGDRS